MAPVSIYNICVADQHHEAALAPSEMDRNQQTGPEALLMQDNNACGWYIGMQHAERWVVDRGGGGRDTLRASWRPFMTAATKGSVAAARSFLARFLAPSSSSRISGRMPLLRAARTKLSPDGVLVTSSRGTSCSLHTTSTNQCTCFVLGLDRIVNRHDLKETFAILHKHR